MSDRYFGFFNGADVDASDVDAYFTRESFTAMFGDEAAEISDEDIEAAADAARDVSVLGVYLALPGAQSARSVRPVLEAHEYGAGAEYFRYADDEASACARAQEHIRDQGQLGRDAAEILAYFGVAPLPTMEQLRERYFRCFASSEAAVTWAENAASIGSEFRPEPSESVEWYTFLLEQVDTLREQGEWVEPE